MKPSLHCPDCDRAIVNFQPTAQQVTCASCQREYGIVYGKLSKYSSIHEALLYLNAKLPRFYKRHYTLQITTPDRTLRLLQFSLPGKVDRVPTQAGDLVSALYTLHGNVMQTLVAINNHTTGKRYVLPKPIPSASQHVATVGTAVMGLLLCTYFSGMSLFLASSVSAIGLLVYLKLTNTAQLTQPALETQGREGTRLLADQRLLRQQRKIERRLGELEHDSKANQVLVSQLESLHRKMAHLDQSLYVDRIHRTQSAIALIGQQTANNQRLVQEYRRTLKMIEIEVETSWIADQLPDADNFCRQILLKLEELKAIEDQNQALKFQLAAYEEVKYHRI
jgi:hypothetical protein